MICDGFYFLKFEISLKNLRDISFFSLKWRIVRNIEIITWHAFAITAINESVFNHGVDIAHYPQLRTVKCDISAFFLMKFRILKNQIHHKSSISSIFGVHTVQFRNQRPIVPGCVAKVRFAPCLLCNSTSVRTRKKNLFREFL